MDANSIIMQMPPQIRQQFDAETDHSRKGQIVQMFARKVRILKKRCISSILASISTTNAATTTAPIQSV